MLKNIRKARSFTQQELSEKTGISISTIQKYERNARDINKATLHHLLTFSIALNCPITDLLTDQHLIQLAKKSRLF